MKKTKQIQKVETKAPAFNIETLISQAVSGNASVDTVERLLAMRKQLRDEWAKQQFDNALASLQGEIPVIEKGQRAGSGSFTYNYAPLEFIISKVKDIIAKYGFSYTFDTAQNGKLKVMCKVKHKAGHTEISEFELAIDTNARMNTSQQYGAALTYGKRYAFVTPSVSLLVVKIPIRLSNKKKSKKLKINIFNQSTEQKHSMLLQKLELKSRKI